MADFLNGMDKIEQVATNRNRKWVFEKLKEKNITKVKVSYSGGRRSCVRRTDCGGIESIIATLNDGSFSDFDESIVLVPNSRNLYIVHPEMTDEQRLVYLITKPVYDNYYSVEEIAWNIIGELLEKSIYRPKWRYVDGILTWDVVNKTISDFGTEEFTPPSPPFRRWREKYERNYDCITRSCQNGLADLKGGLPADWNTQKELWNQSINSSAWDVEK